MAAASRSWPTTNCSNNSSATSWMSAMMTSLFATRSTKVTTLLTLFLIWDCVSSRELKSGLRLNDFINHFEPLYYEHDHVRAQHERLRRSIDDTIRFEFHAHNRRFKIHLRPSSQHVFADDILLENTDGPIYVVTDYVYSGVLEDDDHSDVHGIITKEGIFDGTISTPTEDYYVEPSSRYTPELSTLLTSHKANESYFPAIIYKASDVTPPWQLSSWAPHCASHELFLKRRESMYNHCQDISECEATLSRSPLRANLNHTSTSSVIYRRYRREQRHQKQYSASHSRVVDREWNSNETIQGRITAGRSFQRRSTIDPKKVTCMLYLQADHLFYQKLGSEEACIESMTRHVQRVNAIYKNIDFNGDGKPDGLTFMIKRIKVHTEKALQDVGYRFPGNYGVEKFLELFSEEDYDAFCLAYMFTYRDFEGGTLGLAWTGDLKNAGGVCEKNGHYRGSLKSLNTGIVTLLNYGKHVPPAVSHVTLAHEIGHNFGSPHDPENNKECTPGGEDGNYIMFARATSGDKRNNNKFSPCSLKSINSVLNSKARDAKGCFTEPQTAICGNGVVEVGEDCDCGWEEDCRESCCYPMRTSPLPGETPCTLRPYRVCSPSQGPCCTHDCRLKAGVKCRDDNGCRDSSFCDGRGPACPPSNNKPNKTICNEEFVCFMGECTGSICIAYGLESCQCSQGPGDPQTKSCELCCKLPGDDQPCLSSFQWNAAPYDVPDMNAKPGTPCNNYNGYCDVFQRCREVDPSGPLATLRRLLLSDESIASLKKWVEDHWYGVLFIAVGFIVLMVVIVRLFGKKHSKTSRVRRVSRRRPVPIQVPNASNGAGGATEPEVDANGHIVHPAVVRPYLPFKKKVREKAGRGRSAYPSHAKGVSKTSRSTRVLHRLLGRSSPAKVPVRKSSGAVSSTEKVKSWLEREDAAPVGAQHSQSVRKVTHPISAPDLKPQSSRPVGPLTTVPIDDEARNGSAPKPKGIGRSISENPQRTSSARFDGTVHGPHKTGSALPAFRRSQSQMAKSQSYNPNPGHILRKSESQSQLLMSRSRSLSASQSQSPETNHSGPKKDLTLQNTEELDSDIEGFNPPSLTRMESQVQLLSPSSDELPRKRKSSSQSCKTSALPASRPEPHVSLPKSATDSKLKAIISAPALRSTPGATKRASSLEVLNVFKFKPNLRSGSGNMQNQSPQSKQNQKKDVTKRKGAGTTLGLGPVRVVLKWHGKSSAGTRRKKPSANSSGDGKKKRQVIVYSNPKPTLGDKGKMRAKNDSQDKEVCRDQKGGGQGESTRKLIRIAENPLDRHDLVNPGYTASPEPERSQKMSNSALRGTPSDSSSGHISIHIDAEMENVDC